MKYFFKRDTIGATLAVFMLMGLLSLVPLNTHILDPLKMALSDISFNDLSFAVLKTHKENAVDDKIVVINIGEADRTEIAAVLNKIKTAKTKVIGLDVLFLGPKEPAIDSALNKTINGIPNIVLSEKLNFEDKEELLPNYFSTPQSHSGYVNFVGEKAGVIRYFSPFETIRDSVHNSFAAAVVEVADEVNFNLLKKRKHNLEYINYKRQEDQYFIINYQDILNGKATLDVLNNKVVLIGYVNNNPANIEDKHFTPLNEKFVGKSIPDMNGVIIHANIVSMILSNQYIKKTPAWVNWTFALILTWVFMAFILKYYLEHHIWFHLAAKTIQLILTVVFIYLGIFFTKYFSLYINLSYALVGIVLAVDVLYFYEGFAQWAIKKFNFKSLFNKPHH
ncbi:MAG: CHASE2 domain-containing protein [Ferruginibacter sp.]